VKTNDVQQQAGISFLVPAFNEETRIVGALSHAVCWADEVIVINKSSTDRTADISRGYDPKVRVLTVPFSPQGQDEADVWVEHASHDWIFVGTCSEVPTRQLILQVRALLADSGEKVDLVKVPRRMYSLGCHHSASPWNIAYYPFLFHRRRAVITNVIHEHFKAVDPARVATIPYTEECCVHHLTHQSARGFIDVHAEYAQIEAAVERDPEQAILQWLKSIHRALPGIMRSGNDWPGILSCWTIYNMMNVLLVWEKSRGLDVRGYYQQLRSSLLADEWGVFEAGQSSKRQPRPTSSDSVAPAASNANQYYVKTVVFLAYWTANILYHGRHPGAIPMSLRLWASGCKARMLGKQGTSA
jgi:hypothetical protein